MKKKKLFILLITLITIIIFLFIQNNFISITNIELELSTLPRSFDGFKIVHLSDLHSKKFSNNQQSLVFKINKAKPNLILFTGDLVDSKHYVEENSLMLIKEIVKIAPVYFVTGNHEKWSGNFHDLEQKLIEQDVKILRNDSVKIKKGEDEIQLIGIDDPSFNDDMPYADDNSIATRELEKVLAKGNQSTFNVLLSHRPELFSTYANSDIDLTFSGHAHGGQIRLPFIGGVISPNQGFFPKYANGKYTQKNSVMIVNRGLGNSIIPQRIFNRPEIIIATLKKSS